MTANKTAFVRTPNGVKVIVQKASVTLSFVDIGELNNFVASGAAANTPSLLRNIQRNAGHLEAMSTAELQRELERREADE